MSVAMGSKMKRSWIAACRGRIAAALCMLMLLSSLLPAHAASNANPTVAERAVSVTRAGDGQAPAHSDAVLHHACQLCSCQVVALPVAALTPVLSIRPVTFTLALSPFSCPGMLIPPSEPPRA